MPDIKIEVRLAPECAYQELRWAWLAVHDGAAIGALAVADTIEEVDDETGEQRWPHHATIGHMYSEVRRHGIARKLLSSAQAHLANELGLRLYRSGLATEGGRFATTCAGLELAISPKVVWLHERDKQMAIRRGKEVRELEPRLDERAAEEQGIRMLNAIAALMNVPLLEGAFESRCHPRLDS
ncbi:hypothetical protein GS860_16110 [Rhodococcus hoagii]|nr:hypothetical protein [Prescottella equi]